MTIQTTPFHLGKDTANVVCLHATFHASVVQDACLVIRVTGRVVETAGHAPATVPGAPAVAPSAAAEDA